MGINCSRSECNTTSGCAHRGPRGEWCWFGTWGSDASAVAERAAAIADDMADGLVRDAADGLVEVPITVEQVVNGYRMIAKRIRNEVR